MPATNKFFKWCFVPSCKNTSTNKPNKHFITVPRDYSRKLKWFKAARRNMPTSRSSFLCCEDHFNLEEDMENYVRFKLIGGKIRLKQDVVPHIFKDQYGKRATSTPGDSSFIKQQRQVIKSILLTPMQVRETEASTSNINKQEFITIQTDSVKNIPIRQSDESAVFKHTDQTTLLNLPSTDVRHKSIGVQAGPYYLSSTDVRHKNIGIQARPYYRSKHTQYNYKKNITHTTSSKKITTFEDQTTSPLKKLASPEKLKSTARYKLKNILLYSPLMGMRK